MRVRLRMDRVVRGKFFTKNPTYLCFFRKVRLEPPCKYVRTATLFGHTVRYCTICHVCLLDPAIVGNVFSLRGDPVKIHPHLFARVVAVLGDHAAGLGHEQLLGLGLPPILQVAWNKKLRSVGWFSWSTSSTSMLNNRTSATCSCS